MQPGKRTIEYTLPSTITLANLRQIVKETELLKDDVKIELVSTTGQRDEINFRVVIIDHWPMT